MDYIDAFKNLRTNNKYGRRSPHKAIMMLTVIELYEQGVLSNNEIYYDNTLKAMFLKVWNKILPDEMFFHSEAYLPFWFLQSDSFWHIVPNRGKEDILSLMRDTNVKPSEAKLNDCVKYAELDDDLYFLMTIPSGRSSLKRVLLETYTNLSEKQIDRMAESVDNVIDYSTSALSEYERILSNEKNVNKQISVEMDNELVRQFQNLNEDIQIVLNFQYFSFLKSHRNEREMFKEVCPTIYDLFDKIVNHPIQQANITPSFAFTYDNFLSDLKIALMNEEGSMDIIGKIEDAIDLLRGIKSIEEKNDTAENTETSYSSFNAPIQKVIQKDEAEQEWGDIEVEHVYVDSHGKIIDRRISNSVAVSKKEESTETRKGKHWTEDERSSELEVEHVYLDNKGNVITTEIGGHEGKKQEEGWELDLKENNKNTEELINKLDRRWNDDVCKETENETNEETAETEDEDDSVFRSSVRIGTRVRLLPSQIEGVVVNHFTSKSGEKRMMIKKDDGSVFSALDHPYLYEKVKKKRRRIGESRMRDEVKDDDKRKKAELDNKGSIKEKFRLYLTWRKPESTANGYTSTLDNAVRQWINKEVDKNADSIFSYTNLEDVRLCIDWLKSSPDFLADNKRQHNRMSAALAQYLLFIEDCERMTEEEIKRRPSKQGIKGWFSDMGRGKK